jgi:hypothetical protein
MKLEETQPQTPFQDTIKSLSFSITIPKKIKKLTKQLQLRFNLKEPNEYQKSQKEFQPVL